MKRFLWLLFVFALAIPLQAQTTPSCQAGVCVAQWLSVTAAGPRIPIYIGGTGTTSQAVVVAATTAGESVVVSASSDGVNWAVEGTLTGSGDVTFTGAFVAVAITPNTVVAGSTITAVWTGAYPVEAGGGGGGATSVTGTTNEVFSSPTTGAVILSTNAVDDETSATSITFNTTANNGMSFVSTAATGTLTVNAPSPSAPVDFDKYVLRIKSTNVQTYSWNSIFVGSTTQALPTTSSGSLLYDYILFQYNAVTSKWDMLAYNAGFSQ